MIVISIMDSLWWSVKGGALGELDAALRVFWRSRPWGHRGNVLGGNSWLFVGRLI